MTNLVGKQLGSYHLVKHIGQGGFADVYLGRHRSLNTEAAIKVMHARMSSEDLQKFRSEARTIAALKHPHIVGILDFNQDSNIPFLVMEYATQGTLRKRHPKGSLLQGPMILIYVKQITSALQHAHDQKVIHQDIKPENMLVGTDNKILLSDFGIAAVAHNTTSMQTQTPSGTPMYMAPEQWAGHPRPATDQYALGVVVFEWLNGSPPFHGNVHALVHQHQNGIPLFDQSLHIPKQIELVVLRALAKDPGQRFPRVEQFTVALEHAMQTASSAPAQLPGGNRPPVPPQPNQPTVAAPPLQPNQPTVVEQRSPDLNALYREGVKARTQGDFDRAVALWRQVLDINPYYGNDLLVQQMKELELLRLKAFYDKGIDEHSRGRLAQAEIFWQKVVDVDPHFGNDQLVQELKKLHEQMKRRMADEQRKQADAAYLRAIWAEEIEAWTQVRQIIPDDVQASDRLGVARKNQQCAWMYEYARQFVAENDFSSAKQQLITLWEGAPYHSDPLDLASKVNLPKPLHYEEARARSEKVKEISERSASRRASIEQVKASRRQKLSSIKLNVFGMCCAIFFLLASLGAIVGWSINIFMYPTLASLQSPELWVKGTTALWVLVTVAGVAFLSFSTGYRKTITIFPMLLTTILAVPVALYATWFTAQFPYAAIYPLSRDALLFSGQSGLALILSGLGALLAACGGYVLVEEESGDFLVAIGIASYALIVGYVCVWLILAVLSFFFNWNFGFATGWNISLFYGVVLSIATSIGLTSYFFSTFSSQKRVLQS